MRKIFPNLSVCFKILKKNGIFKQLFSFIIERLHRNKEWQRSDGASGDHWCIPSSRATHSKLPRIMSRQLLNISKHGDSTTALSNVFHCPQLRSAPQFLDENSLIHLILLEYNVKRSFLKLPKLCNNYHVLKGVKINLYITFSHNLQTGS